MRTFVVALDGSELAESALLVAHRVAQTTGGELSLVQVSPPDDVEAALAYLTRTADTIHDVPVSIEVVAMEPGQTVASGLRQAVEAADADALLCLTRQGHGAVEAAVLGSTTEDILRDFDRPVLIVPRHHPSS